LPEISAAVMSFRTSCASSAMGTRPRMKCAPVIPLWCRKCVLVRERQRLAIATLILCGIVLVAGASWPPPVYGETRIIPSVSVSERYDTNVYLAPPELLPPGQRRSDFVTSLAGDVQLHHKSRDVEASLTGGANLNGYVYNTDLNYVGTSVDAYAKLDGWVGRLAENAKLQVSDRFLYTPEPPGFITGVKTPAGDDPFSRGIQGFRANTFSNTASASGSYPVFRGLSLQGSYAFSFYRVGSILALTSTGASFFDTNVHSYSVGPGYRLTRADSISLSYQQSLVTQTETSGTGPTFDFNTQELWANYSRVMPDWTVTVRGGGTLIEPASKAFATAAVTFQTNPERSTFVQLDLSRRAAPSFFVVGGAMISNVGQVLITHRLAKRLNAFGSVNYGYNETVPDRTVKFTNLTGSVGLRYNLTRTMITELSYNYNDFKTEQPGLNFEVLRHVVAISLTARWK
jgi:hypothetical protein